MIRRRATSSGAALERLPRRGSIECSDGPAISLNPMPLLRARLSGLNLEYEASDGSGDAVLLLHGGGFATWFTPLVAESALARYRRVRPHRAGYAGSEGA